jgi:hypothetical protein
MSGNGKHFVWQDWQTAYEIIYHGLIELDAPVALQDQTVSLGDFLQTESLSPEETFIEKESYQNLSEEAKDVISLIIGAPQEILDCFTTPKYNKISKERIAQFLSKNLRWDKKRISFCFQEIREFVSGGPYENDLNKHLLKTIRDSKSRRLPVRKLKRFVNY